MRNDIANVSSPRDRRVRRETRVWIDCTVCGPDADPPAPRFADERELWQYLFGADEWGWTRLDDGRVLCPAHRNVIICEREGHLLGAWAEHALDAALEWRFCRRCGAEFEQRPASDRHASTKDFG